MLLPWHSMKNLPHAHIHPSILPSTQTHTEKVAARMLLRLHNGYPTLSNRQWQKILAFRLSFASPNETKRNESDCSRLRRRLKTLCASVCVFQSRKKGAVRYCQRNILYTNFQRLHICMVLDSIFYPRTMCGLFFVKSTCFHNFRKMLFAV